MSCMQGIYLDNQSAMLLDPRVLDFAKKYLIECLEIHRLCIRLGWQPNQQLKRPDQR